MAPNAGTPSGTPRKPKNSPRASTSRTTATAKQCRQSLCSIAVREPGWARAPLFWPWNLTSQLLDARLWTDYDGMLTHVRAVNDLPGTAANVSRVGHGRHLGLGIDVSASWYSKAARHSLETWRRFKENRTHPWALNQVF